MFFFQVPVELKDELVQVAVDRLAQVIQVAKSTDCLSGRKCKSSNVEQQIHAQKFHVL